MLAVVAALSLGFTHAKFRSERVAAPVLTRKMGPVGLEGLVEVRAGARQGDARRAERVERAASALPIAGEGAGLDPRGERHTLVPGNWIHVTAVLMPPPGPAAPGGYDFGRAAWFDRIGGVGFAYGRAHFHRAVACAELGRDG